MIPGCEISGRSGTEVHFSHIQRTFWGSFASVSGSVGSCSEWWIQGQSYTTSPAVFSNSAFSTDGVLCATFCAAST